MRWAVGFQQEGVLGGGASYGKSYGDDYGGSAYPIYDVPRVHNSSDDPRTSRRRRAGVIQHRRNGLLIGERIDDTKRLWRFEYVGLQATVVDELGAYFDLRRFRVIPDVADPDVFFVGNWVEAEFYPVPRIGGIFDLAFTVEEVD